jgi:high affinity Mn2+ porin
MRLAKITAALVAAGLALPALAAPRKSSCWKSWWPAWKNWKRATPSWRSWRPAKRTLKAESENAAKGLDSPRLSQYEPELTVRLKAVEKDALEMKKSAKLADKDSMASRSAPR